MRGLGGEDWIYVESSIKSGAGLMICLGAAAAEWRRGVGAAKSTVPSQAGRGGWSAAVWEARIEEPHSSLIPKKAMAEAASVAHDGGTASAAAATDPQPGSTGGGMHGAPPPDRPGWTAAWSDKHNVSSHPP